MAWRFKASKYKNTVTKFPKREEWISDIAVGNLMHSCGNHIKASNVYMSFNTVSTGGGNLALLPVQQSGRVTNGLTSLPVHSDYVTDFDFSPYDDYLLATGSADTTVKVWLLPNFDEVEGAGMLNLSPSVIFHQNRRVENVLWNPVADGILAATVNDTVNIYDVQTQTQCFSVADHGDQIQSMSWCGDGVTMATSCKDKQNRILDPRAGKIVQKANGHSNIKDSRILWIGNTDKILSTGFNNSRSREVILWDSRNLGSQLFSTTLDTNTGTIMPLYDSDTGMLYLIGKGDSLIKYCEVTDKAPYINENSLERSEQIKGAALVPKRSLDVMSGEVNRLLLLTQIAVIPTPCIVPRKSYTDYHDDIFPDTPSGEPVLNAASWTQGSNAQVKLMSMNPNNNRQIGTTRGHLFSGESNIAQSTPVMNGNTSKEPTPTPSVKLPPTSTETTNSQTAQQPEVTNQTDDDVIRADAATHNQTDEEKEERIHVNQPVNVPGNQPVTPNPTVQPSSESPTSSSTRSQVPTSNKPDRPVKPAKAFSMGYQSKFRHVRGQTLHKSTHITNLRNVSRTMPWESDMFQANAKRCAIPIDGAGGHLAVIELNDAVRLPDTGVPTLQHGAKVMDFEWDPFNDSRLAVACDDAKISIWNIPEGGIKETVSEASLYLRGHTEKIYFVHFHPLARDLILTGSYDMSVRIWDLESGSEIAKLEDHPDQIYCAAWSPDGKYIATVCKDGNIRIFNPRKSMAPLMEGPGTEGRVARIVWVLDGQYLLISGFNRSSGKVISLHDTADLSKPLATEDLQITPSVLVPYYMESSQSVFLNSRGDGFMYAYEILDNEPYLFPLAETKMEGQHQALSFLPQTMCDVRKVEVARAVRLTATTIEPMSFTVPRVKMEYFQDDLFPDIADTSKPTMTSDEWCSGKNTQPIKISLKPAGMKKLSEAPVEAPKASKYDSYSADTYKTDEEKKDELLSAMSDKLDINNTLPQDEQEGCDSDEWGDED